MSLVLIPQTVGAVGSSLSPNRSQRPPPARGCSHSLRAARTARSPSEFAERAGRESASPMPTRDQVTELLDEGDSFEGAGRALGVPQQLVNSPTANATRDETIPAWVRERAARELTQEAR
jgi:hypothetical protein